MIKQVQGLWLILLGTMLFVAPATFSITLGYVKLDGLIPGIGIVMVTVGFCKHHWKDTSECEKKSPEVLHLPQLLTSQEEFKKSYRKLIHPILLKHRLQQIGVTEPFTQEGGTTRRLSFDDLLYLYFNDSNVKESLEERVRPLCEELVEELMDCSPVVTIVRFLEQEGYFENGVTAQSVKNVLNR